MAGDGKVVGIHGGPRCQVREPRENVVRFAEDLLEMARSGQLAGFAAALMIHDGTSAAWRVGRLSWEQVGRLEELKAVLVKRLTGDG